MAKLETIRPSIYGLDQERLTEFIDAYRKRRLVQLTSVNQPIKAKATSKKAIDDTRVMLSSEEKMLAKELGISLKTLMAMRTK